MASKADQVPLSKAAMRRLMKEAQDVQANPLPGISLAPRDDNLAEWHANVMISGGEYDGLVMHILLDCPHDYPNSPPKAYFVNPVSYQSGATQHVAGKGMSVCLNLFGNFAYIHTEWGKDGDASGWSVSYTLQTALLTLQGLLPADMLSSAPSSIAQSMAQSRSCQCHCGHSGASPDLYEPRLLRLEAVAEQPSMQTSEDLRQVIEQGLTLQDVQVVGGSQWLCLLTATGQQLYASTSPPDGFVVKAREEEAPAAPEASIMCYALHKTPSSDPDEMFGFGVAVDRQNVSTPAEALSREAFDSGVRTSSQNALFQHFLPLFISEAHWLVAKPSLFAAASIIWTDLSRGVPEKVQSIAAARVVCRLMNNVVIDVMKADSRSAASDTFISAYFSLLRLLVRLAADHPEVQQMADQDWSEFMASSENRTKLKCPNIGDILPLLCISSRFSWADVASAYQEESHKRNVRWYLHDYPHLENVNPKDDRISITFSATAVSRRMACFQAKFSTLGKAQSPFSFADGTVPAPLIAAIKDTYRATDAVSTWNEHYEFLGLRAPSDIREALVHALGESKRLGYHGDDSRKRHDHGGRGGRGGGERGGRGGRGGGGFGFQRGGRGH